LIGGGADGGEMSLQGGMTPVASIYSAISFIESNAERAQFLIGVALSQLQKIVPKFLAGDFEQLITAVTLGIKFFSACKNKYDAFALTLVFTLISVAIAISLFFVPVAGFAISIAIGMIEQYLANRIIREGLC